MPAVPLPDLQDEQAELLAFWLRERGWFVAPEPGSEPGDLRQAGPQDDPFYVVRQRALELACSTYDIRLNPDDVVVARAEAFRKFLMGVGDE